MSVIVNSTQAEKILKAAIDDVVNHGWLPQSQQSELIGEVILGSHLTYRYILTTGILAKATNPECDPLALQAGASSNGAYDARSLCHHVLVPMERELLGGRLGNSNEPFLNKPARYQELSIYNPVRRGNDAHLLQLSIKILSGLQSSINAGSCLKDCIYFIFQRPSRDLFSYIEVGEESPQSMLIKFAHLLISNSHEGETCALLTGATYTMIGLNKNLPYEVKVHKVNQAGSSSREILDIDVYLNGRVEHTVEVKDKYYTPEDVQHAVSKAVSSGCRTLVFAAGPNSRLTNSSCLDLSNYWSSKGVNLYFVDVFNHFISVLSYSINLDAVFFLKIINYHAEQAKVKDDTLRHIISCAHQMGW